MIQRLRPQSTPQATVIVDRELHASAAVAQLVRYDVHAPAVALVADPELYQINMCLTPRLHNARGCYTSAWAPHRYEKLGDIFVVPPGATLRVKGDGGQQTSLLCSIHRSTLPSSAANDLKWTDQKLAATTDVTNRRVKSVLVRIAEEVRQPGLAAEQMLELLGQQLAMELARFYCEAGERAVSGGLAGWRLRLIDERLNVELRSPSLAELADLCELSVRQLTRGFKASRGCTVYSYIENRRIETAKRLLLRGEAVKEVAFALGFSARASFAFAFRRATGMSPSQFQRRQARAFEETAIFMH